MSGGQNELQLDVRGKVLEIGLGRAPVNSITKSFSRAIYAALRQLQDDPSLSVGLIYSTQAKAFSAGWDLKGAAEEGAGAFVQDEISNSAFGDGGFAGITEFWNLTKPVICAVDGPAIGGGFEIVLAADITVAAETAFFCLPEMQRGIIPDAGGVQRLPKLIPPNVARELLLTGRRMYAPEAHQWGLVHKVVPKGKTLDAARALAAEIGKGAPLALVALKEMLSACDGLSAQEATMAMKEASETRFPNYWRMMNSQDAIEGVTAFAEKRDPEWRGK